MAAVQHTSSTSAHVHVCTSFAPEVMVDVGTNRKPYDSHEEAGSLTTTDMDIGTPQVSACRLLLAQIWRVGATAGVSWPPGSHQAI